MYMRVLLLVSAIAAPAMAQGWPPGPPTIVPDCPYEYIDFNPITLTHRYKTKTCAAAGGPVSIGESPFFFELLTPACDLASETCRNPTVGSGNPSAKLQPVAEPKPVRALPPAPRSRFTDWKSFAEAFLHRRVPCRSRFLNIQQIRKFADCKLTLPGERGAQLEKIKKATPDFLKQYLNAKSFGDQEALVRDYGARITALLEVQVPIRDNVGNVYKALDLPTDTLPKRPAPRDARNAGMTREAGVVKVTVGNTALYFKLTESTTQWFRQGAVTLRSGIEVDAAGGDVPEATLEGKNNFVHRLKYKGNMYLVHTKNQRKN